MKAVLVTLVEKKTDDEVVKANEALIAEGKKDRADRRERADKLIRVDDKPLKVGNQTVAIVAIVANIAAWCAVLAYVGSWFFNMADFTLLGGAFIAIFIGFALSSMIQSQQPNEARVYTLFGNYIGTYSKPGLYVIPIPFLTGSSFVSLAQSNLESTALKMNDERGNPLSVSVVVVYRVARPAASVFSVKKPVEYLSVQTEGALRHVVSRYPYYAADPEKPSLLNSLDVVNDAILAEVSSAVALAGIDVIEVRINSLAYSVEIAQSMLQRQQAEAVLDARTILVEGSVGIVSDAVAKMESEGVSLSEDRKASLTANLLTVLVGERAAQPVINLD